MPKPDDTDSSTGANDEASMADIPPESREVMAEMTDEGDDETDRPAIAPGDPSLENTIFVLVGVLLALFVLFRAAMLFGG